MADRASPVFRFNPPSPPSQSIHEYVDESDGHRSRSSPPASFEVAVERPPSLSPVLEDLQGLPRSPEARALQSLNPSNSPRRAHGGAPIDDRGHDHDDGLATRPMDDYVPLYEQPPYSQSRNPSPRHDAYEQEPSMYHENVSYGRTAPRSLRHASTHSSSSDGRPVFDQPPINRSPNSSDPQHGLRQPHNPVAPRTSPARSYHSYSHTSSLRPSPGVYYASPAPEDVPPTQSSGTPRWKLFSELPRALMQPDMPHQYTQIGPTGPSYPAFASQASVAPVQSYPDPYYHHEQHSEASSAHFQRTLSYPPFQHMYQQQFRDLQFTIAPNPGSFQGDAESSSSVSERRPTLSQDNDMPSSREGPRLQHDLLDAVPTKLRSGDLSNPYHDYLVPLSGDGSEQGGQCFSSRSLPDIEVDEVEMSLANGSVRSLHISPSETRIYVLDGPSRVLFEQRHVVPAAGSQIPAGSSPTPHSERDLTTLSHDNERLPFLDAPSSDHPHLDTPPRKASLGEFPHVYLVSPSENRSEWVDHHVPQTFLPLSTSKSPLDVRASKAEMSAVHNGGGPLFGNGHLLRSSSQMDMQAVLEHTTSPTLSQSPAPQNSASHQQLQTPEQVPYSKLGTPKQQHNPNLVYDYTGVMHPDMAYTRNGSIAVGEALPLKPNEVGFQPTTSSNPPHPPTPNESRKARFPPNKGPSPKQQHRSVDNLSMQGFTGRPTMELPIGGAQVAYGTSPYSDFFLPLRPQSSQSATSSTREAPSVAHPNGVFWGKCRDEAKTQDEKMMQQWNNAVDVLLVFAALFSAVLTAFLMEFYKFLEPEPATISSQLLQNIAITLQILVAQENLDNLPSVSKSTESHTSTAVLWVNGQWFVSLTCSIGVAISGMVVKQWLQYYDRDMGGLTAYEYVQRRQYRHSGLLKWKVPMIVTALPIAMHISVALFLSGMVLQLFLINEAIATAVLVMLAVYGSAYIFVTVMPLFDPECPYKSPMVIFFQRLARLIAALPLLFTMTLAKVCNAIVWGLALKFRMSTSALLPILKKVYGYSRVTAESREIQHQEQSLKADAVLWMLNSCQNLETVNEALQAIASLECDDATIKKFHNFDVPEMLVSRANLPLPSLEHEFWSRLPVLDKKSMNAISSSSAPAYIGSLLRLWHHPITYDIMSRDPVSITRASGVSTLINFEKHRWIFGDWMYAWRQLGVSMDTGLPWSQIQNLGWSKDVFVAFLCTEVTYHHLCSVTTQRPPQASADDLWDANPFPDLQHLLEMHKDGTLTLHEKLLVMVLDTLLFCLANVHLPSHLAARRDVLLMLLNMMSSEEFQDIAIVRRLSAIIDMFASKAGDQMQVYRAHVKSRGVMKRQDAYESIKRSVSLLLNKSSLSDGAVSEPKKPLENATHSEFRGAQVSYVDDLKPARGRRFPFIGLTGGWRVIRNRDLEIGLHTPTDSSDASRAMPRSPLRPSTFVDWIKEAVQPKPELATPAQQNESPSERSVYTLHVRGSSGSRDVLDFKLPFFETVKQVFRFTARHNESDSRGGDLLLDLPTDCISEILSILPQNGDQWEEYRSLTWLLRLLMRWYFREEMPRETQIDIIWMIEQILNVLRSTRRTEFASKVLPFFAERLRASVELELDMIGQALYTLDGTSQPRRTRRFLMPLVRTGVIQALGDRLLVQPRTVSVRPWADWKELALWWEEDLANHSWTTEAQEACRNLAKAFRGDNDN